MTGTRRLRCPFYRSKWTSRSLRGARMCKLSPAHAQLRRRGSRGFSTFSGFPSEKESVDARPKQSNLHQAKGRGSAHQSHFHASKMVWNTRIGAMSWNTYAIENVAPRSRQHQAATADGASSRIGANGLCESCCKHNEDSKHSRHI